MNIRIRQQGFTIIELLIATMVFSVVLMLCTYGLLQVGRIYNRGVTNSKTQEAARNIIDDVSQTLQFGGGQVSSALLSNGSAPNISTGFCIGGRRYSMLLGHELSNSSNDHGLVADNFAGTCSGGLQALDLTAPLPANSREFLSPLMRVANLTITDAGNNLWQVTVRVVSGDDDLLNNPASTNPTCKIQAGSQFCSISELTTVVQKRIQ
ncbi:MAG TPA: type II secretion system protein [Candidatus Saccharimonadales bacterium]|nr:type II secretion system protein [Candidatus Saccharimonadales bacterium]